MKRFVFTIVGILFSIQVHATDFGLLGWDPWPFFLNPIPWTEMDGVWVDQARPQASIFCVQTLKTQKSKLKEGQVAVREMDRKTGDLLLIGIGNQKQNQLFGTLVSGRGKHPFAMVAPKGEVMPPLKGQWPSGWIQPVSKLNLRIYIAIGNEYIYSDILLGRLTSSEGQLFNQYCE